MNKGDLPYIILPTVAVMVPATIVLACGGVITPLHALILATFVALSSVVLMCADKIIDGLESLMDQLPRLPALLRFLRPPD